MRRLLLFLLLLGLGFLALRLAVGDEEVATAGGGRTQERPEPPTGPSIPLDRGGTGLQISGGFTIARQREIPAAGGGVDREPIYELTCKESQPTADGRHRLDDVTVRLFDQGVHAANLTATRALVELQVDDKRQSRLRENREIDLDDAVLATVPGTKFTPVRLSVGRARVLLDSELVALHTPDPREPVTVVVDGERPGERGSELRGRGLRARLPRDRAAPGRLELVLLSDPVLTMAGIDLKASGELHYVEDLATGAALLTVDRDVRIDLAGERALGTTASAEPGSAGGALTVRGDRLHGWLQRSQRRAERPTERGGTGPAERGGDAVGHGDRLVWTMLRLLGSRASVTSDAVAIDSPRLTMLPGPTGEMASITADGGSSELRELAAGGATFRSSRPIHLLRIGAAVGALHRTFGFPAWTLGPLHDLEVVTFDGASEVDAGDGVSVAADRGLHLFRQASLAATLGFTARGFGNVSIAHGSGDEKVEASGDAGFVLRRTPAGDDVVFGRDDPTAVQSFELRRGPLCVRGNGAAHLLRAPAGAVQAWLRSDRPTFSGSYGRRGDELYGELRTAHAVEFAVREGAIDSLVATGDATEVELVRAGQTLIAAARRIEQLTADSWRLTGTAAAPAVLRLPPGPDGHGKLTAPHIDLHRVASQSLLVDAVGDGTAAARLSAQLPPEGGAAPGTVEASAARVRLWPFACGPAGLLRHLLGMPRGLADVVAVSLAEPWVLADGAVVVDVADSQHGELHGQGEQLVASQGSRALLLVGDARTGRTAVLRRHQRGERVLTAEGARVRFVQGDGERVTILTTFPGHGQLVPPSVTFRGSTGAGDRSSWLRGVCRGEIEVLPEAVLFRGPVTAHSLLDSGSEDPAGMHVVSQHLQMSRHRDTGDLTKVEAGGGVTVRWRDMTATSERVELDLLRTRCTAEGPEGALVRFANGQTWRAKRIEANYVTYAVRCWNGRLEQAPPDAANRR